MIYNKDNSQLSFKHDLLYISRLSPSSVLRSVPADKTYFKFMLKWLKQGFCF
jgi:hypothetical protein